MELEILSWRFELELESGIVHPYVHFKPFVFLRHMIYRIDRIRIVVRSRESGVRH